MERKEAGGDEEKIHWMNGRVSRESENQQNRSEEKQGDRCIKADSFCRGSRVKHIRHAHPDCLGADYVRITPLQLPAVHRLGCLGRRTGPFGKINFPKLGAHGQKKFTDPASVLEAIRPLINSARLESDLERLRLSCRYD